MLKKNVILNFFLLFLSVQQSAVIPSHADLTFTVLLFNADSAGNPLEHFSAEEAGQSKNNPRFHPLSDRGPLTNFAALSASTALNI